MDGRNLPDGSEVKLLHHGASKMRTNVKKKTSLFHNHQNYAFSLTNFSELKPL